MLNSCLYLYIICWPGNILGPLKIWSDIDKGTWLKKKFKLFSNFVLEKSLITMKNDSERINLDDVWISNVFLPGHSRKFKKDLEKGRIKWIFFFSADIFIWAFPMLNLQFAIITLIIEICWCWWRMLNTLMVYWWAYGKFERPISWNVICWKEPFQQSFPTTWIDHNFEMSVTTWPHWTVSNTRLRHR